MANTLLSTRVAGIGISAIDILDYIEKEGLPAAEALIQMIEAAKSTPAGMKVSLAALPPSVLTWVKVALVTLLKQYRDQLLAVADAAEQSAIDAAIAFLSK